MIDSDRIGTLLQQHPAAGAALAGLLALGAVVGIGALVRTGRRHGITAERAGTLLSAALATGVSAQGMWVFFGRSLHLTLSLRIMFFAFLEIMVLTSALRARAAQQEGGSAGVDGIAMWVLTCLSAVLAATDADDVGTVAIRLTAPLVAAWGWERSMALERRRNGTRNGLNWRITPERILIRLGLADPTDRSAGQVATARRLVLVALAADHARTLRATGVGGRRMEAAVRKLRKTMRRAVEDGGLVDNARAPREVLLDNLRVLSGATALLDLELTDPWIQEQSAPPRRVSTAVPGSAVPVRGVDGGAKNEAEVFGGFAAGSGGADLVRGNEFGGDGPTDGGLDLSWLQGNRSHGGLDSATGADGAAVDRVQAAPDEVLPLPADPDADAQGSGVAQDGEPVDTRRAVRGGEPVDGQGSGGSGEQLEDRGPVRGGEPRPGAGVPEAEDDTDRIELPRNGSGPDVVPADATRPVPAVRRRPNRPAPEPGRNRPAPEPVRDNDSGGPAAAGQQKVRRDPAVRARVRELRAADKPTAEIAAELGVSTRTVGRILADMEAAAHPGQSTTGPWPAAPKPVPPAPPVLNPAADVNPARALISSWDTGFHAINATANANAHAKSNAGKNGNSDS